MSLNDYVAAQQRNLKAIRESPHYSQLIETVDRLYRVTLDLCPVHCPRVCFGKMLLVCHKSLLSAATLIVRGQPEDSAPISRRAIEVGHLAVAVHLDSQNYIRWLDYEKRMARNEARLRGERPKNDPGHKWGKEVLEHPLLSDLRTFLGMLSDHYSHFSPEFEGNLQWSESIVAEGQTIQLEYFDTGKRTIHLAFINLATVHLKLLDIFNACFKDKLQTNYGWLSLRSHALALGRELVEEFKVPEEDSP
jgi:hypothetical protein